MKIALFPGSFDPVTIAHVDILKRSISLFDKIIIGIGTNSTKQPTLPLEIRERILKDVFVDEPGIEVAFYQGLTVDFCRERGAQYLLRNLSGQ